MTFTVDRLEDGGLAVLETDAGEFFTVPRTELPPDARAGDVLRELPWYDRGGAVRYAVDAAETARRKQEVADLRASLPRAGAGDLEL